MKTFIYPLSCTLILLAGNVSSQNISPAYTIAREVNPLTDARVSFSGDGKLIGYGTLNGELVIFNPNTGKQEWSAKPFDSPVLCIAFSPNHKNVIVSDKKGIIKVYDLQTAKEIKSIQAHDKAIMALSYNPDGFTFLSGGRDNSIKVWDAGAFNNILTINDIKGNVRVIRFSPDGKNIIAATSALSKGIRYFDLGSGQEVRTIDAANTQSISISPDESIMASANLDKNIMLWNPENGFMVSTLSGHSKFLSDVSFSPGGRFLLSGSSDHKIKLWDLKTGQLIYTFDNHSDDIVDVEYSPDGRFFASTSWDNTLRIWDLSPLNLPAELIYETVTEDEAKEVTEEDREKVNEVFKNLHFETGKSTIKPESFGSLDQLAALLQSRPKYKLYIYGHTDNQGNPTLNYQLSIDRALAVKNYLIGKGTEETRLVATGFGATKPIADNRMEEGRKINRRVELILFTE